MSRFGPQVLPDYGPSLAEHLSDAFDRAIAVRDQREQQRRQREADKLRRRTADTQFVQEGGRFGKPPDRTFSVDFPGDPQFDAGGLGDRDAFVRELAGRAQPPTASPLDSEYFDQALAQELRTGGPSGVTRPGGATLPGGASPAGSGRPTQPSVLQQAPSLSDGRDVASGTPGAFDPASGRFGGSARQLPDFLLQASGRIPQAPPPRPGARTEVLPFTGRDVVLDEEHYIDTLETPAAQRARDREAQLQLASALRGDDRESRERTRDTRDTEERDRRYRSYVTAGMPEPQARAAAENPALADNFFRAPTESWSLQQDDQGNLYRVNPRTGDVLPVQAPGGRQFRRSDPQRSETNRDENARNAAILRRIPELMKPKEGDLLKSVAAAPGLSLEEAVAQATREYDAVVGGGSPDGRGAARVEAAVARIRSGAASVDDLRSSGFSSATIAEIERRLAEEKK